MRRARSSSAACRRGIGAGAVILGERARAGAAVDAIAAAGHERIGQQAHEQVHGIEGGLLRTGRDFAGGLGQARRVSVPKTRGMPPVALKKLVSALATFCWLPLSPPGTRNSSSD